MIFFNRPNGCSETFTAIEVSIYLLYNQSGEAITAESRSEIAKLSMNTLVFVRIYLLVVIASIVSKFPAVLQTPNTAMTTVIATYQENNDNVRITL